MIPISILDLVRVRQGSTPRDALDHARDLAAFAEGFGYRRFWVAEHHNMPGIASAATSVVIGHIAAGTSTIRVGAGGIMLPNHAPLIIAEQFGTLATLFPGRIDLGLGRAPGTDQLTLRALRRDPASADRFPNDVLELQALLGPVEPGQTIQAVPGAGTEVPLWILGSSLFGAQLAAEFGLPYAFASHFAPDALDAALDVYRARFKPSKQLDKPYAMAGVNIIAAESDAEARHLATTQQNVLRRPLSRGAWPQQAADRRYRQLLDGAGKGAGRTHAGLCDHRRPGQGAGRDGAIHRADQGRRIDDRVGCFRSCRAAALVRAHRQRGKGH